MLVVFLWGAASPVYFIRPPIAMAPVKAAVRLNEIMY